MSREITVEDIGHRILSLRKKKVILDFDLSKLYGVETRALNQAVKRNKERFPTDFMFRLSAAEWEQTSSQIVMRSKDRGKRYRPYAFTEEGVAMLSSVLRSERAVAVNIAIMRAFVKLREMLETNRALRNKFAQLEQRVGKHDEELGAILEAIRQLMAPPEKPKREIGFHVRETAPPYRTRRVR